MVFLPAAGYKVQGTLAIPTYIASLLSPLPPRLNSDSPFIFLHYTIPKRWWTVWPQLRIWHDDPSHGYVVVARLTGITSV